MELYFVGEFDEFTKEFLKEQYITHPELITQEMELTGKIIPVSKFENK